MVLILQFAFVDHSTTSPEIEVHIAQFTNITSCKKQVIHTTKDYEYSFGNTNKKMHDTQDLPGRELQQQYNASNSWCAYISK